MGSTAIAACVLYMCVFAYFLCIALLLPGTLETMHVCNLAILCVHLHWASERKKLRERARVCVKK